MCRSLNSPCKSESEAEDEDEAEDLLFNLKILRRKYNDLPKSATVKQDRVREIVETLVEFGQKRVSEILDLKKKQQNELHTMKSEVDEILLRNDTILIAKGKVKIPASRKQLAQTSEVFEKIFTTEMEENLNNVVKLEEYDPLAVKILVRHCALGLRMEPLAFKKDEVYLEVLGLAGSFQIPTLLSVVLPDKLSIESMLKASTTLHLLQTQQPTVLQWGHANSKLCRMLKQKISLLIEGGHISSLNLEQIEALLECHGNFEEISSTWTFNRESSSLSLSCESFLDKACFQFSFHNRNSESEKGILELRYVSQPSLGGIPVQGKLYQLGTFWRNKGLLTFSSSLDDVTTQKVTMVTGAKVEIASYFMQRLEAEKEQESFLEVEITQPSNILELEVLCKWANETSQAKGKGSLTSVLQAFFQIQCCSPKSSKIVRRFVDYFASNFRETFLEADDCFLLGRNHMAFILRRGKTKIFSEIEALQALLKWANVSCDAVGLELLESFVFETEEKLYACSKYPHIAEARTNIQRTEGPQSDQQFIFKEVLMSESVIGLKNPQPTIFLSGDNNEVEEVFAHNIFLFRNIEQLLPLIRFPFIKNEELLLLSLLEKKYLDNFTVANQLRNEALMLQLAPKTLHKSIGLLKLDYDEPYMDVHSEDEGQYGGRRFRERNPDDERQIVTHFRKRPRRSYQDSREIPNMLLQNKPFPFSMVS